MQLARRNQDALTLWTHFQRKPHEPSSLPEEARTHSLSGHIFKESLISSPSYQQKPWHTHILDTFSADSSALQVARRSQKSSRKYSHSETIILYFSQFLHRNQCYFFIPPGSLYQNMLHSQVCILTVVSYKQYLTL